MARHTWGTWDYAGHGRGDGTPAGVVCARQCLVCRAEEIHDTAVSTPTGATRPMHRYRDGYGEWSSTRPACLGEAPRDEPPGRQL